MTMPNAVSSLLPLVSISFENCPDPIIVSQWFIFVYVIFSSRGVCVYDVLNRDDHQDRAAGQMRASKFCPVKLNIQAMFNYIMCL